MRPTTKPVMAEKFKHCFSLLNLKTCWLTSAPSHQRCVEMSWCLSRWRRSPFCSPEWGQDNGPRCVVLEWSRDIGGRSDDPEYGLWSVVVTAKQVLLLRSVISPEYDIPECGSQKCGHSEMRLWQRIPLSLQNEVVRAEFAQLLRKGKRVWNEGNPELMKCSTISGGVRISIRWRLLVFGSISNSVKAVIFVTGVNFAWTFRAWCSLYLSWSSIQKL